MTSVCGEVDFGPGAVLDLNQQRIGWFNRWLNGTATPDPAPVRLFVMGENAWRDEQEWPLARTLYTPWHLGAGGRLSPAAPGEDETPDRFTYDPNDPAPTFGGKLLGSGEVAGPFDQRANESRGDVLVYTSAPLEAPMEITGPVKLELWVATNVPDTDFTAILIDVHPDGRAAQHLRGGRPRAPAHPDANAARGWRDLSVHRRPGCDQHRAAGRPSPAASRIVIQLPPSGAQPEHRRSGGPIVGSGRADRPSNRFSTTKPDQAASSLPVIPR